MANQQQVLFAETIAGMKKAFKRRAYDSDSDSDVDNNGNRGQKLKRRARFARKGQLVPTAGPDLYREIVDYAGVRRSILHRNPPLLDDEGYEIDSDDDPDRVGDAVAAAAEFDPYANVRLENILAPLTAITDLPSHPTLSKPFTSETLSNLVDRSCEMMRKENHSLWQVRHLWTTLCGDFTWAPCETMIGPKDIELYTEDHLARHLLSLSQGSGDHESASNSAPQVNGNAAPTETVNGDNTNTNVPKTVPEDSANDGDVSMADLDESNKAAHESHDPRKPSGKKERKPLPGSGNASDEKIMVNGDGVPGVDKRLPGNGTASQAAETQDNTTNASMAEGQAEPPSQATNVPNPTAPTTQGDPKPEYIHPMFATPLNAKPDRDAGLPDQEAEHLRKLLSLYVQKQEEICRGAQKLHSGLLRAERLRKEVLHWSKAEAHSGVNRDLSDGEDWYDKEEWGLDEDLKKGQDEEEEDTTTTGKKTRARR